MLSKKLTPLLRQYLDIKQQYSDCLIFFRLGDFYELFFEDAEVAAAQLGITLTKRGQVDGSDIPMCGVPHHHGDNYLAKLLKNGFKVAICEQIESPEESKKRGQKAIIKRQVVRIATPGTLTEEKELSSSNNNFLMNIISFKNYYNIVYADISTGEINLKKLFNKKDVLECIENISPSELLIPETQDYDFITTERKKKLVTYLQDSYLDPIKCEKCFKNTYSKNKKIKKLKFDKEEIIALGATINYFMYTQNGKIPAMSLPVRDKENNFLEIDFATKKNLEIAYTLSGEKYGSLFDSLNFTLTSTGERKLLKDLTNPLTDLDLISQRLDLVNFFYDKYDSIKVEIEKKILHFPDLARSLNRVSLGRGGPRDLLAICKGLKKSFNLSRLLYEKTAKVNSYKFFNYFYELTNTNIKIKNIIATLEKALSDNLPLFSRDGNFIKSKFDEELDRVRFYRDKSKNLIVKEEELERKNSGINNLKIKYNNFLGYFIDISSANKKKIEMVDSYYIHRQTLKNSSRYTTKNLIEISENILEANYKAQEIEERIYKELVDLVLGISEEVLDIANIIARIDVSFSWANYAKKYGAVRPVLNNSNIFHIKAGRHPSVEKTHATSFIANDCFLNNKKINIFKLITGPNMSGKSTYLRQNALILIIAQSGGFCPAEEVNLGICDKLFCRVGSGDELAKGNSTFMVEMIETANILNSATDKSFVILDEIGRGTSTYDGMSLAWATIEYLIEKIKCKTLFATHYNQLSNLKRKFIQLELNSFKVKKWKSDLIFLHKLIDGVAESSYGIEVAKMAGLPEEVIKSSKKILQVLEGRSLENNNTLQKKIEFDNKNINSNFEYLEDKIQNIDLNKITPIDALNILDEIKTEMENKK